jgi:hypothetical protein
MRVSNLSFSKKVTQLDDDDDDCDEQVDQWISSQSKTRYRSEYAPYLHQCGTNFEYP